MLNIRDRLLELGVPEEHLDTMEILAESAIDHGLSVRALDLLVDAYFLGADDDAE